MIYIERWAIIIGRWMLALYFFIPGVMKFIEWDSHIDLMERHDMHYVAPLLFLAAIFQILGSLLLMFNRYTEFVALSLSILVLLINFNLHDFWNYSGIERGHEMQNFIKNLAIFAGLLILTGSALSKKVKHL
ncbi:DoxX family protein [Photobacterium damselae]|uniref:DoxX family protein n=1 Tax=Photobacterium damselae TaxID=38293 RepID=UPI00189E5CCC|nr:DoxX family protein [Photobacterium damselae]MBF7100760.1 DoxX family protein [Photobacterium damselae]